MALVSWVSVSALPFWYVCPVLTLHDYLSERRYWRLCCCDFAPRISPLTPMLYSSRSITNDSITTQCFNLMLSSHPQHNVSHFIPSFSRECLSFLWKAIGPGTPLLQCSSTLNLASACCGHTARFLYHFNKKEWLEEWLKGKNHHSTSFKD